MKFILVRTIAAALLLEGASHAAASGTVTFTSCAGGGIAITKSSIDWQLPGGAGTGCVITGSGTDLRFAGNSYIAGTPGTISDYSGATLPITGFLNLPGISFALAHVGSSNLTTLCMPTLAASLPPCSLGMIPGVLPFVITATATGSVLSLAASGPATDYTGAVASWRGVFTVPFPGITPNQLQMALLANTPVPGFCAAGACTSSYSASIAVAPVGGSDTTPPSISPLVTGTPGADGSFRSDVSVAWDVSDPESGIIATAGCGPVTLTSDTPGTTLTCSATNGAGLTASAPIVIRINHGSPFLGLPANMAVAPGQSIALPVTLSMAAPPGGVTITLSSSDPSVAAVPANVFIPAGATGAVRNGAILTGLKFGQVTIAAYAPGYAPVTAVVTVTVQLNFSPPSITFSGTSTTLRPTLLLSAAAPADGLTVQFFSENPMIVSVPATLLVPPNSLTVPVPVTPVGFGTTKIHAVVSPFAGDALLTVTVAP